VNYLVVPRFLAGLIMLPVLTALADVVGMAGGYAVSVFVLNANPTIYFRRSMDYLPSRTSIPVSSRPRSSA